MKINPDAAPPGYKAQSTIGWSCVGCAFRSQDDNISNLCTAPTDQCLGICRDDQQDVIFVKKT